MHKHSLKVRFAAGVLSAALLFTGCNMTNNSAKLVDINKGKDSITYGYGNFLARYTQADYDQYYLDYYGDSYWREKLMDETKTTEESVKDEILTEMETLYQSRIHASEFDVKLTDADNKKIKKVVNTFFKDNPKETIEAMGATEEYMTQMLEDQTYEIRLKKTIMEKKDKELSDKEVRQTSFSYVEYRSGAFTDKNNKPVDFSNKELKAMADETAKAGDFEAAVKKTKFEVEQDNYTTSLSAKKAADESGLPEELFKQLKGLGEGETTGVIRSEEGYMVARLDSKYDKDWTKAKREDLQSEYYEDTMEAWKKETKWDVNKKLWKKVKFDKVFKNTKSEAEDDTGAEGDADESADSQK